MRVSSRSIFLLLVVVCIFSVVECFRRKPLNLFSKPSEDIKMPSNVQEMWYKNMKLDHFTYGDNRTFDLRFAWNNTFYTKGGPIFFYTGNEGSLETFIIATGMMFELAPLFNASLIFAEHRFYGQTQPFKEKSYSTLSNVGYLTSEQALADYAELLTELKRTDNQFKMTFPADTRVISFGGSYGGMLSAWFRMKYPHIVTGAWAGSAPLIYFRDGGVEPGVFDNITSRTYVDNGCNRYILANVWNATLNLSRTDEGRAFLMSNSAFTVDPKTPIRNETDAWSLNAYMREAIEYMAMVDYPYPTNFLKTLPGWPVNMACGYMNSTGTSFSDKDLVTMVGQASNIYYNYNGLKKNFTYCIDYSVCGDQGTDGLGNDTMGWPWQECSEIVMGMCAHGGSNDVFWEECGSDLYQTLHDQCVGFFGQLGWTSANWNVDGVKTLYGLDLSGASNLILTQGHLDPWSGGGYKSDKTNVANGVYVFEIPGSAHHLDLRQPNTCDPNTITNARWQIIEVLKCWVNSNCNSIPAIDPLPSLSIPANVACKDVVGGYPWGQKRNSATPTTSAILLVISTILTVFSL